MSLMVFGPGYCGSRIAAALRETGRVVHVVSRKTDRSSAHFADCLLQAQHIVSTVPPSDGADPVLAALDRASMAAGARLIYLSSTGVYGNSAGAWLDETAQTTGRRADRIVADAAWRERGACVLRLPGIYGPGRSVVDRLLAGDAHRVDAPGHVFSRIHVDDIVGAVIAAMATDAPAGIYNVADDRPAPQAELIGWAAARLGIAPPPSIGMEDAALSPAARAFYRENRRVSNEKAKRLLNWHPRYPDYRAGLRALIATARPSMTSAPPTMAAGVQR